MVKFTSSWILLAHKIASSNKQCNLKKISSSYISLIFCYISIVLVGLFFYPKWENGVGTEATLSWDASGYYMYLPATFIYKDLKQCKFHDSILKKYNPTPDFQQAFVHEASGNYVMKYSMGQAITMLPWFTIAHIWASNSRMYPADGFSYPYQICIGIGLMLYSLIGFYFLRKVLLIYFSEKTTALVLPLLLLGTNLINYVAVDQAMTHGNLFTLYACILYLSHRYWLAPNARMAILIGLLCGLATLIRPTEIICLLIPLLWGADSIRKLKQRFTFLFNTIKHPLLLAAFFAIIVSLQPIYWHYVSGDWIVYSYQDQGFSWLHPHFKEYCFSSMCGWLRYSPLMMLPFLGIPLLYLRKIQPILLPFLIFLSFYIVLAWDIWDYGGTAGRAMVQYYPLLAFALAALFEFVYGKKILTILSSLVVLLFTYASVWWVYHAHHGSIQALGVSHAYWKHTVGRWSTEPRSRLLIDNKDVYFDEVKKPRLIWNSKMSKDNFSQKNFLILDTITKGLNIIKIHNPRNIKKWLRANVLIQSSSKEWDTWKQNQIYFKYFKDEAEVQSNMIRIHRILNDNETKTVSLDSKPPSDWDYLTLELSNYGSIHPMYIHQIEIISFDE